MILILHLFLLAATLIMWLRSFLTKGVEPAALSLGSELDFWLALDKEVTASKDSTKRGWKKPLCVPACLLFLWDCHENMPRLACWKGRCGKESQIIPVVLADAILISNSWVNPGQDCPAKPSWAITVTDMETYEQNRCLLFKTLSFGVIYFAALLWQLKLNIRENPYM